MMHVYDKEWKDAAEYHASIKEKKDSTEPTKIVIVDRYPVKEQTSSEQTSSELTSSEDSIVITNADQKEEHGK